MGKRAAAANKDPKSPKKAKVAPAQEAPVQAKSPKKAKSATAPEAPVLAAIDALSIPTPAREMLKVAIPYCLADREKHTFQVEVLDSIQRLFQGVDQEKVAYVSELEAKLLESRTEKEKHDDATVAKKEEVASKKQECDENIKLVDEATDVVETAKKDFEEAKRGAAEFDAKKVNIGTGSREFRKAHEGVLAAIERLCLWK